MPFRHWPGDVCRDQRSTVHVIVASAGPYRLSRIASGAASCQAAASDALSASPANVLSRSVGIDPGPSLPRRATTEMAAGVEYQTVIPAVVTKSVIARFRGGGPATRGPPRPPGGEQVEDRAV